MSTVGELQVSKRNARFQQWEALLTNRNKRQRAGEFVVQGVRPINLALEHGWPIRALIHDADRSLSDWAKGVIERTAAALRDTVHVSMAGELIAELSGKDDGAVELLAVVEMPPDDLSRIELGPAFLGVVFDRPSSPGNIGTMIRASDAFGASGVIVTGHAADPYDPRSVRASTGSLFALPVVRESSHVDVLAWARGAGVNVVGTDEHASIEIADHDLTGPTLVVIGNETSGMSAGWRESCDTMVRIPISGSASSLNAASAATVFLYEAARQRG